MRIAGQSILCGKSTVLKKGYKDAFKTLVSHYLAFLPSQLFYSFFLSVISVTKQLRISGFSLSALGT